MEPQASELCIGTLFYSLSREPDTVVKQFCAQVFDLLVKRLVKKEGYDEATAKDIAVRALEKVLQHPLSDHREMVFAQFWAFCYRPALWLAKDEFAKKMTQKRGGGVTEPLEQAGIESRIEHRRDEAKSGFSDAQIAALHAALNKLPEELKIIVVRHHLEGETLESIGANHLQGLSDSTVSDRKKKALALLRKALEGLEELE
jgi:RNA polymerase sigma factor (sigma-70 family)